VPRPTAADLGLVLLAAGVLSGAYLALTQSPQPPTPASATHAGTPTPQPTPTPSPTTSPTRESAKGQLLVVGADLAALEEALTGRGWEVLLAEPGESEVIAEGALDDVGGAPTVVLLQVEPGSRTTERVRTAVTEVRAAYPEVVVVLVGPFDAEAAATTQAVEQAAGDEGLLFLDPVALGWTEGADPASVAAELDVSVAAVTRPAA